MSSALLLINRGSGGHERGRRTEETAAVVRQAYAAAGRKLDAQVISPRGVEDAMRRAIAGRPGALLVAGGDGTVSAAARALGGTGIPLGVLPMGTFNLAARDLGVPLDLPEAAAFLAQADPHEIDVLEVGGRACLCTAILGFYPEFSRTFERRDHGGRWWRKALRLATSLPKFFTRARAVDLRWSSDEGAGEARTKFSAFVPGRYKPAAGLVPARTGFTSGVLTAYIGRQDTAAGAVRGMLDYVMGRQEENPDLTLFQCRRLTLEARGRRHLSLMIDGEILRLPLPLELTVRPAHLRVLTTAEALEP